jgi:peptidoglycan LD-endopeptidase LytH
MPRHVRGMLVGLFVYHKGRHHAGYCERDDASRDWPPTVDIGWYETVLMFHRLLVVRVRVLQYNAPQPGTWRYQGRQPVVLWMMRRPPVASLILFVAGCAQPVTRPRPVPIPMAVGYPVVLQSSGPDGESPPPARAAAIVPPVVGVYATVAGTIDVDRSRDFDRLRERHLAIPVAGVGSERIQDTFNDGRDGGERVHNAIDILAPRNTPIIAADDGVILRMSSNALGGITIFAADPDHRFVYYYAHLDHYDASAFAGRKLTKGDTIGYVGTTGNAPKDVPHLHFQIMRWPADGKYWAGEPINPFPFLKTATERR